MEPITAILAQVAATRAQVQRDRADLQELSRRLAATEIVIRASALTLHPPSARLGQLATRDGPVIRASRPP